MHMDETTVKVLKYDRPEEHQNRKKSYMWLAQGGPREKPAVLYQYFDSRSSKYIKHFIKQLVSKRKEIIKPLFDEFHRWLLEIQPQVPESLKFGRAIKYALSAWEHLLNYIDCPEIYLDNSIAERGIKPFVMGKKNWLFCGSEDGARSSCFLYSLIECAKINNINPEEYLSSIFELAADIIKSTEYTFCTFLIRKVFYFYRLKSPFFIF